MTHDLKYHARQAINSLYELLFDRPAYDPSIQAGSCCIKPYHGENGAANPASFTGSMSGDDGRTGRLASGMQDKVGSVASSASSAAASLVSTIGSGSGGGKNDGSHTIGHHHHHGVWHSTSTDSKFSHWQSVLHDYWHSLMGHSFPGSDFWQQLQSRLRIDHLARSWNLEPHIVLLLLSLPLMLLFLSSCLMLGAGNTSEEPRGPGRKPDPTKVEEKEKQSPPTYAAVARGSSSTSNAAKDKKIQGSKKGGAQDSAGSIKSHNQLGNDNSISSWSALLGSTGFRGGEALNYKPIDIYAAMKSAEKSIVDSVEDTFAPGHDDGIVSNIIKEIVGPTEAQHEQKEIGLDNKEDYFDNFPAINEHEHNINHIDRGRASRSGPAGPGGSASNSSAKIRVPRPHGVKEADRHRHQPHLSFRKIERESAAHQHQTLKSSFAAKVMDFTQENPIMKNLDGISGGVLGAATVTVATLASTAQAATTALKENIPFSVGGLAHDLRGSFDKAMEQGGLEGSGFDEQDDDSYIPPDSIHVKSHKAKSSSAGASSSTFSSQRAKENSGELISQGSAMFTNHQGPSSSSSSSQSTKNDFGKNKPTMVANPPRLRKRSVVQSQPETAANIAAATATAATTVSIPSSATTSSTTHFNKSAPPASCDKSAASIPSNNSAAHTHVPASTPSKAAPSSDSTKPTYAAIAAPTPAKAQVSVEDISSRTVTHSVAQTDITSAPAKKRIPSSPQKDDVKAAATEAIDGTKKAASNVGGDIKTAVNKAAKGVKKVGADSTKGAKDAAAGANKGAEDLAGDTKEAAKETAKEAKVAVDATAEKAHKLKGAAADKANEIKGTAVKKANEATEEAKDTTNAATHKANELKGAAVKKSNEATKKARDATNKNTVQPFNGAEKKVENAVEDAEKKAEGAVKNATETAHKVKDTDVAKPGEVTQATADTVEDVEKKVEGAVKNTGETAHHVKDVAVKKTNEAANMTNEFKDTAVMEASEAAKDTKYAVDAATEKANEAKNDAVEKAYEIVGEVKGAVGAATEKASELKEAVVEKADEAIEQAKDVIDRTVVQPIKNAEKKVEDSVKYATETAYKARDAAVEKAGEVAHAAADTVKGTEKKVEGAIRNATATAYKAKDATVEKAGEVGHTATDAAQDAEKTVESAVMSASATAHKDAKDADIGKANEVAQAAADAVKDAERKLEDADKRAAEVAKDAKDAAAVKAGRVTHATADALMGAEKRLQDAVKDAYDSFDDGSLIDADEDESLDEMDEDTPSDSAFKTDSAATTASTANSPVAALSAHTRSASPTGIAQNAVDGAVEELADVAESLSSMFAGFKDSVARALKDVKDMASHVGPALAPASISVSPAHATGHLELSSSSSSSSSSNVFKQTNSKQMKAVTAAPAASAGPSVDAPPTHEEENKNLDGMLDGRSYSDVVKVTPVTTPKLSASKLPGGFPSAPATDDSSVHSHDETLASSSDDHSAPSTKAQEFTVDQSGNKVPVVDARRDSGFNLLT
ncbi:hypothetical protein BG015_010582 [Linnemannia schmuckeri]|uniref:Uncharacterized protein n=1 Tax=Linnemannia schmuckeri TaxID=64567 RepID=A0A9P5RWA5_9FUNG|nr:hypothetical protein BG015_010582 [Linnemannia schmuckeri]